MDVGWVLDRHMSIWLACAGIFIGLAIATQVLLEIARHLQWRKHRGTGFVPGTQHWCLFAVVISFICSGLCIACLIMWAISRSG